MFKSLFATFVALAMLSACSGTKSTSVAPLQKKDKILSCKEIMLEQNEAAFYRKTAEKNKGPSIKNVFMPLGYITTFVSAENAIEASDSRIEYLNRIYDILDCDNPASPANQVQPRFHQAAGGQAYGAPSPQTASYYNNSYVGGGGTYSDEWYW